MKRKGAALPHSEESERAVLGAVMLYPDLLDRVAGELQAADFFLPQHGTIFNAMLQVRLRGEIPDDRTLQAQLELQGDFHAVGGIGYIATLDLDLPSPERLDTYIAIVKDRSVRRALMDLARSAVDEVSTSADVCDVLSRLQESLPELQASAVRSHAKPVGLAVSSFLERVENEGAAALLGIPTGFDRLDRLTGGLCPGHFLVVGGRPGLGKTALALNIAQNVGLGQGRPVGIYSLEMSEEELVLRLLCSEAQVPALMLREGYLSSNQWKRLIQAARRYAAAPIYIDDTAALTITQLEGRVRRDRDEHKLELVIVDYLQLLRSRRRAENRNIEIAEISRSLKELAKSLHLPVIALAQLSREVTKRSNPRPQLSDLRDSGAMEQDADKVIFVHRESAFNAEAPASSAELIVAKQRQGETGTVEVTWQADITTFRPLGPAAPQPAMKQVEDPF